MTRTGYDGYDVSRRGSGGSASSASNAAARGSSLRHADRCRTGRPDHRAAGRQRPPAAAAAGLGRAGDAGVEQPSGSCSPTAPGRPSGRSRPPRRSRASRARHRGRRPRRRGGVWVGGPHTPGGAAAVSGPKQLAVAVDATAFLLVGDEAALPAISQLLEELPVDATVAVHVEVSTRRPHRPARPPRRRSSGTTCPLDHHPVTPWSQPSAPPTSAPRSGSGSPTRRPRSSGSASPVRGPGAVAAPRRRCGATGSRGGAPGGGERVRAAGPR